MVQLKKSIYVFIHVEKVDEKIMMFSPPESKIFFISSGKKQIFQILRPKTSLLSNHSMAIKHLEVRNCLL